MSFGGQSDSEKQRDTQVGDISKSLADIGSQQNKHSKKAWSFFKESAMPVMDFFKPLLKGDRNAMEEVLGPEISRITSGGDTERRKLSEFMPRGGGSVSASNRISEGEDQAVNNLIFGARPAAAQGLTNLLPIFNSASQGSAGLGIGANQGAANINFGLNQESQAERDRKTQAWSGLGQGAGSIAGGIFAGK